MQLCGSLSILWHCLSLGLEWKLTFSSPVATAEFSKFADLLSATLSQHHISGFEIDLGIPSPLLALFIVMLPKAHLTSHSRMSGSRCVWVITVITKYWLYSPCYTVYNCTLFYTRYSVLIPSLLYCPSLFPTPLVTTSFFSVSASFMLHSLVCCLIEVITYNICLESLMLPWQHHRIERSLIPESPLGGELLLSHINFYCKDSSNLFI